MIESLENIQYAILGVMITGGIAITVYGGRILQDRLIGNMLEASPAVPQGVKFLILGSVTFGLSAGYLMRDIQSDEWKGVLE